MKGERRRERLTWETSFFTLIFGLIIKRRSEEAIARSDAMNGIQEIIFNESDLASITTGLFEETNKLTASAKGHADYEAFRRRVEKHFKELKDFARKANASRFDIRVRIGLQPTVDLGLSFDLRE
jgi:hypothetical protein